MKKLIYGGLFLALIGMVIVGCQKENQFDDISPKNNTNTYSPINKTNTYTNYMEFVGEEHNIFLDKVTPVTTTNIGELVSVGSPDQLIHIDFIEDIVTGLGQPDFSTNGELNIELPSEIIDFLNSNPILWNFHNDLLEITQQGDQKSVEVLLTNIENLEGVYSSQLEGIDLDAMYAVGAVARHSASFWSNYNSGQKASDFSRYMLRDWAAAWTVGAVSIFFPGIGLGVCVAAAAVASVTTDL